EACVSRRLHCRFGETSSRIGLRAIHRSRQATAVSLLQPQLARVALGDDGQAVRRHARVRAEQTRSPGALSKTAGAGFLRCPALWPSAILSWNRGTGLVVEASTGGRFSRLHFDTDDGVSGAAWQAGH